MANAGNRNRRGGRARTGTVERTRDGRWRPIAVLADGSRARLDPLPKGTSRAKAKDVAGHWTEKWNEAGFTRDGLPRCPGQARSTQTVCEPATATDKA